MNKAITEKYFEKWSKLSREELDSVFSLSVTIWILGITIFNRNLHELLIMVFQPNIEGGNNWIASGLVFLLVFGCSIRTFVFINDLYEKSVDFEYEGKKRICLQVCVAPIATLLKKNRLDLLKNQGNRIFQTAENGECFRDYYLLSKSKVWMFVHILIISIVANSVFYFIADTNVENIFIDSLALTMIVAIIDVAYSIFVYKKHCKKLVNSPEYISDNSPYYAYELSLDNNVFRKDNYSFVFNSISISGLMHNKISKNKNVDQLLCAVYILIGNCYTAFGLINTQVGKSGSSKNTDEQVGLLNSLLKSYIPDMMTAIQGTFRSIEVVSDGGDITIGKALILEYRALVVQISDQNDKVLDIINFHKTNSNNDAISLLRTVKDRQDSNFYHTSSSLKTAVLHENLNKELIPKLKSYLEIGEYENLREPIQEIINKAEAVFMKKAEMDSSDSKKVNNERLAIGFDEPLALGATKKSEAEAFMQFVSLYVDELDRHW